MGLTTQELKRTSTTNHNSDNKGLEALHLELSLLQIQQILPKLHLSCLQNSFNNLPVH
jgi:hypothetical protein